MFENSSLIGVDIETRSFVDIKESNLQNYVRHKSTEILYIVFICVKTGKKRKYDLYGGGFKFFHADLKKYKGKILAHNYSFEKELISEKLVNKKLLPKHWSNPENYLCTMAMAYRLGFTTSISLEKLAERLNIDLLKDNDGKRLIQSYSKPLKNRKDNTLSFSKISKTDQKKFMAYCETDVKVMIKCYKKMVKMSFTGGGIISKEDNNELDIFNLFQRANERGVKVDLKHANIINKQIKLIQEKITKTTSKKFGSAKGGGPIVMSSTGFKDFLNGFLPKTHKIDNVQEGTLINLEEDLKEDKKLSKSEKVKVVIEAVNHRKILNSKMLNRFLRLSAYDIDKNPVGFCYDDGIVKYFEQYYGTYTGRGAGRDIQLQNFYSKSSDNFKQSIEKLPKANVSNFTDSVKILLRQMIIPVIKDNGFFIGDFKAIEARLGFWLIGSDKWLSVFKDNDENNGFDPYVLKASEIYETPPEKVSDLQRKVGKELILSANYGMSGSALHTKLRFSDGLPVKNEIIISYKVGGKKKVKKIDISEADYFNNLRINSENILYKEKEKLLIIGFKKGFESFDIPLEVSFKNIDKKPEFSLLQNFECAGYIDDYRKSMPILKEAWASVGKAFKLVYENPGEQVKVDFPYCSVTFFSNFEHIGILLPSNRVIYYDYKQVSLSKMWPSKVFQNIVQSMARDVMTDAALRIDSDKDFTFGFDLHDEIVSEGLKKNKKSLLKKYEKLLETTPDWLGDLSIKAEVEYSDRYKKI